MVDGRFLVRAFVAVLSILTAVASAASADGKGYVSNADSDSVTVFDLSDNSPIGPSIPVGNNPRGLAATPDGLFVYVANRDSDTVSVISTATDAVVATVTLTGTEPYNLAVTPDGARVYVVCKDSSTVSVISTTTNLETTSIVLSTATASPEGIAITPDGAKVYVVNRQDATVDVISTASNSLVAGPLTVGSAPRDAAVTADGSKVIVVGEGTPRVILTATDTLAATPFADPSDQRDVAVAGNLAFVTNFSGTLDVYDLSTPAFVTSINLSGSTPYAVVVNPEGTRAWVAFVDSSNIVDVDLSQMSEGTSFQEVGNGPRGIAAVFSGSETPVVSYFLPKNVKVKIAGEGKDSLLAAGFFDDGGAAVDFSDPFTLEAGGFSRTFSLAPNGSGTVFAFKDANLSFSVKPNIKGSSRGLFRLKLAKTTLGGLVDPDEPLELHFRGTGLPDARGTVGLTAGKYRLGKVRGTLVEPAFFPSKAKITAQDGKPDVVSLKGGFRTSGGVPGSLGTVRILLGDEFSLSLPGASFVRIGDAYRFSSSGDGATISVILDFGKELLTVKTKGVELGALDGETVDLLLDDGTGGGAVRITVRLGSSGTKRFY